MDICIVWCYQAHSACLYSTIEHVTFAVTAICVCRNAGSGASFHVAIFTQNYPYKTS
jgi:hypothetical protein